MATAIVLDADAVVALVADALNSAVINGGGELVFTTKGGSTINLGTVKDHGSLTGLSDDDHGQYALADGTRGDFASTAQGTLADNARKNLDASGTITAGAAAGSGGTVEVFTIVNDGTSSTGWENRIEFRYDATVGGGGGSTDRLTFFLNEYGEIRCVPGKHNTVGFRFFTKDQPGDTSHDTTVPMLEMMDDRTTRTSLWSLLPTGIIQFKDVHMNYVLVLGPSDTVPANTPAGTVIVRTT